MSTTHKTFELKLEITTETVSILCPSGTFFSYPRKSLPSIIYNLTRRVLLDDSNLCKHIAETIESEPSNDIPARPYPVAKEKEPFDQL